MQEKLEKIYSQLKIARELALGYPGNKEHAFPIDLSVLGTLENTFANTHMISIGVPYSHKPCTANSIKELEQNMIATVFTHLGSTQENSFGYVTGGGTEANFAAIWWHREFLINKFKQQPILISSTKSHNSLDRIK